MIHHQELYSFLFGRPTNSVGKRHNGAQSQPPDAPLSLGVVKTTRGVISSTPDDPDRVATRLSLRTVRPFVPFTYRKRLKSPLSSPFALGRSDATDGEYIPSSASAGDDRSARAFRGTPHVSKSYAPEAEGLLAPSGRWDTHRANRERSSFYLWFDNLIAQPTRPVCSTGPSKQ